MTVAVTGASGFIGNSVVSDLTEAGHVVRALSRHHGEGASQSGIVLDFSDNVALQGVFARCDTVVHLAAKVHDTSDMSAPHEYHDDNVVLSATVARACASAGVRRLIFISSVKAVAESTLRSDRSYDSVPREDPYGSSKLQAERVISEIAGSSGMEVVTLRFPLVYGPGMRANMRALAHAIERGFWIPVPRPRNRRSVLFIRNAVAAIQTVVEHGMAAPGIYFVADDQPLSTAEITFGLAAGLGVRPRIVSIPAPLGAFAVRISRSFGWRGKHLADVIERVLGSLVVDPQPFNAAFGFTPPYTSSEGLRLTGEWLRKTHSYVA